MIEKLFGIKLLESCFNLFLSAHGEAVISENNWENKNSQPWRKSKKRLYWFLGERGTCPHYDLIELCAEAMGIKPSELGKFEHFCGFLVKTTYLAEPICFLPHKGGTELIPFCCCQAIRDILSLSIDYAKSKRPKPVGRIPGSISEKEREKIKDFLIADEGFKEGQQILKLWRQTFPKIIGRKRKRYSEEELISKMENLLEQLKKQAAGELFHLFDIPCKVAPKYTSSILYSLV